MIENAKQYVGQSGYFTNGGVKVYGKLAHVYGYHNTAKVWLDPSEDQGNVLYIVLKDWTFDPDKTHATHPPVPGSWGTFQVGNTDLCLHGCITAIYNGIVTIEVYDQNGIGERISLYYPGRVWKWIPDFS